MIGANAAPAGKVFMEDRFHLDDFKLYAHLNRFMEYNRIELVELSAERAVLRHISDENSLNINGIAHGGLLMSMMDIAASVLVRTQGENCATNTMSSNFLRPARGTIYAEAEFVKRGRRINVVHAWCYGEDGELFCDSSVNLCRVD